MKLLTGNEIIVKAALASGAEAFYGYPITPTTETLTGWAKEASKNSNLIFLQTEDEPAAGFAALGSALVGKKTWTATAAAGHILMQDPLMVAEAERIPFVMYVGQRGGPSTGTVIYSQQELNLARDGGNGEGMRLVLGPSNLQELYDFTILAFDWAYRYRLPVIVLGDGYLSKTMGEVMLKKAGKISKAEPILGNQKPVNLRNTYSQEKELAKVLKDNLQEYAQISREVERSEIYRCGDAEVVVFAWGSVSAACREAVRVLRSEGRKVGLFRPITLKPFGATRAKQSLRNARKVLIVESAFGQFGKVVLAALFGMPNISVDRIYKPGEGVMPEEIEAKLREML